jgi:hypothetical protein
MVEQSDRFGGLGVMGGFSSDVVYHLTVASLRRVNSISVLSSRLP